MSGHYLLSTTAILAVWIIIVMVAAHDDHKTDKVCLNGGVPGKDAHRKCVCQPGFKGYNCSQRVTPCEGRPCRNGGRCSDTRDGTFTCTCSALYKGLLCEQKVRPCDSGPCKNGGNCTDDGVKCFYCQCTYGFKGPDCTKIVQPCEIKPCKNGGQCVNKDNGRFKCTCQEGYGGTFCDKRDGLYASKILSGRYKDISQLEKWFDGAKSWRLCYRASDDGWVSSTFHARCDYKHPSVTIIRCGRYIFGAYSDKPFGGSTGYTSSSKAFIFSLVNKDNLPPFKSPVYRYNEYAVCTNPSYGPTFGGGHDIYIANSAAANSASYANLGYTYKQPSGYSYQTKQVKSLLAGTFYFTPNEIETFYLG